MRFGTRKLLIFFGLIAVVVACSVPYVRRVSQPDQCTLVMAADSDPKSFPTVNGYSVLDSNDQVLLAVLHKLTQEPAGEGICPDWLDLRLDGRRRPLVHIRGEFVLLGNSTTVYFVTDDDAPRACSLPLGTIAAYELPQIRWDRLHKLADRGHTIGCTGARHQVNLRWLTLLAVPR